MANLVSFYNILTTCQLSPQSDYNVERDYFKDTSFDFIVVGAGAAGSVVARRLAENKNWNVALLESGGLPNYESEVGGFFINLLGTDIDWKYTTEPSRNYCKGFEGGRCRWPSGKVLGGSTTTNCMVYTHSIKQDFDDFAAMGYPEWGWKSVRNYLTKAQNATNPPPNSAKHGINGPLKTSIINSEQKVITKLLIEAGEATGSVYKPDEDVLGMYTSQNTIYEGLRQSAAKAYLKNGPANLHIFTDTHVSKVLINKNNKAYGVKVVHHGMEESLYAAKEVILSAGAIRTPQILMLSGIGPADHLAQFNIPVIKNLPVGDNLMDHFMDLGTFVAVNTDEKSTNIVDDLHNFCSNPRTGPLTTSNVLNIFWFLSTQNQSRPDVQIHHLYYQKNDQYALRAFLEKSGVNQKSIKAIINENRKHELIHYMFTQATPKSKGTIRLKSTNPNDHPLIRPGYFSDKNGDDMKALIGAAKVVENAVRSAPMRQSKARLINNDIPECKDKSGEAYWDCHFRNLGGTAYHYCGTAAIGSVVRQDLKVKGIKKLRVIDASILPKMTDRNLMSVAYLIGEMGADLVKRDY